MTGIVLAWKQRRDEHQPEQWARHMSMTMAWLLTMQHAQDLVTAGHNFARRRA